MDRNFERFLVLLKSLWRVRYNRIYFIIFGPLVWNLDNDFYLDFVGENSKKIQKKGSEGKFNSTYSHLGQQHMSH
jgi:hypothetical protein